MFGKFACLALGALLMLAAPAVEARPWKPAPNAVALDYLQIIHQKAKDRVILLWWVAYPMMERSRS